jgi:hypothetical protein
MPLRRPIAARIKSFIARQGRDAVTLHWSEVTGGAIDPVTKARIGGTSTPKSQVVDALVHWPQVGGSTAGRNFAEFDDGDVIIDVSAETLSQYIAGVSDLSFEIGGVRYRQKQASGRLAASWDGMAGRTPLARPILLEVAR